SPEKTRKMAKNGAFLEWLDRPFKMLLCGVEPVVEMIYEATAASAQAPFGRKRAISGRIHASEFERRPRLSAWSRCAWNTATIGGLTRTAAAVQGSSGRVNRWRSCRGSGWQVSRRFPAISRCNYPMESQSWEC